MILGKLQINAARVYHLNSTLRAVRQLRTVFLITLTLSVAISSKSRAALLGGLVSRGIAFAVLEQVVCTGTSARWVRELWQQLLDPLAFDLSCVCQRHSRQLAPRILGRVPSIRSIGLSGSIPDLAVLDAS